MSTPIAKKPLANEQLVEAIVGGLLFGYAGPERGRKVMAARLAGAALLLAAFAPALTRKLLRLGAARRRIHLRTTADIDRPVHDVFEFCRDFENFPRVVRSLQSVQDFQDGRSRWEVVSPSGETLAWEARVTKYVPNVVLAWRSVPGSVVDCNGLIRFSPTPSGGTHLQIQVDYDPCHTGFSDAIRALLESPRTEKLEEELARANSYIATHAPVAKPDATDLDDADTDTLAHPA